MNQVREHWGSKFGFVMAAIGSAIGLGILWKFPYTVGENGGGLFLFTYFICLLVVGIPLFIGELILGRYSERAAVGAFANPKWRIAGWLGVLSSFLIMSFYSVIAGWGMSYVLMSLTGFYQGLTHAQIGQVFEDLSHAGGITVMWHFLFTLITVAIVVSGVRKGIEFWAKHMTRILLILLVLLFIYSTFLEGFGEACRFIFTPKFDGFRFSSAIEALGLAFWTLSIGQGIMISYGSYMKKDHNILQLAGVVGGSVVLVAILSALTIFPVIFTFNLSPQAGPGLVFKTLPYLFAQLPGALVISTLFFVLFVFTALTSAIPLIEVVTTNIMELHNVPRKKAAIWVGLGCFIFGIPSALAVSHGVFADWKAIYGRDFLETINTVVSTWIIPIGGLLISIYLGWIMDQKACYEEFISGNRYGFLFKPWRFFVRYIVPITILIIIIQTSGLYNFDRVS
ncbi:MAG: sodium-dependent transporter [Simkaniaceae bacterium]|nr:sodium-dependent transporter [Simkaniaceae bacterium]